MLNLFRIHGIHYCVKQQDKLTEKLKQRRSKRGQGDGDESDYSDEDFTDLMSN